METAIKTLQDIETLLVGLIKKSNAENPSCVVDASTVPKKDLKGFDSLSALEVLTEFEEETGLHYEEDIFYVDVKPKVYRSVHDIANTIWAQLCQGGTANA